MVKYHGGLGEMGIKITMVVGGGIRLRLDQEGT